MPVTAKLSRKFYERLGDEIANELVDWFNAVDATYRADLERLNEVNFQRFDSKVEQRFAEFEVKIEKRFAEFEAKIEQRFAEFEAKVEKRIAESEARTERRFAALEAKIAQLDMKWEHMFADWRGEFAGKLAGVRADLIKWAFVFWAPTALAVAGLYFR